MTQSYYDKDNKAILLDLINKTNNTFFKEEDFTFGDPEVYSGINVNINTQIKLIPNPGTGWYGTTTVFYSRMDLNKILSSKPFGYNPQVETKLSELLPALNESFGIKLKVEDIIDTDIPPYDPEHPTMARDILISSQSSSLLFTGSYTLTVGPSNIPSADVDGEIRVYYLYIDGYPINEIKSSMISINQDGSMNYDFSFLVNATEITEYSLTRIERIIDGERIKFALVGNFSFKYIDNQNLLSITSAKTVLIDESGFIIGTLQDPYFNGITKPFFENNWVEAKYVVDPSDTEKVIGFYKYLSNGRKDSFFNPAITYRPNFARIANDGRIYTVSDVLLLPDQYNSFTVTKQIRIDRMLDTGAIDPTWNTVYIRSSDANYDAPKVLDLLPLNSNGVMLYFKPPSGLNNLSPVPVVNGERIFSTTIDTFPFTWNPAARLNEDGSLDKTFKSNLPTFNEGAVSSNVNYLNKPGNYLVENNNSIIEMVFRLNPISFYEHIQPLEFSKIGSLEIFNADYYINQPKWSSFEYLFGQSNGKFLVFGLLQKLLMNGELSAPVSTLIRYNANGSYEKELWRSPGLTENSVLTLSRLFVEQYR